MPKLRALAAHVTDSIVETITFQSAIQALMALASLATVIYLSVTGHSPIPDILSGMLWAIIGFYFGVQNKQRRPTP